MKIRVTDNQIFLEDTDMTLRGKELAMQILGSGLGVTSIKQGTLIVFEPNWVLQYIFQIKNDLNLLRLNDDSYVSYLAGSVIDLGTGKPREFIKYALQFKKCRLPTILELEQYERFSTI